jgi:ParB-like chromosome segregation protein Spo0J
MGTQFATIDGAATAMPVTMMEVPEDSPSFTPTELAKNVNRLKDLGTRRDVVWIDPRIIKVEDGFNARNYDLPENRAHLDELKKSIAEIGTLIPLLVRYDGDSQSALVCDGECRLRANLELIAEGHEPAIEAIPCIEVPKGHKGAADRLLLSITANTGKPLSKWELGSAFQRLYNFGWSEEKIATKTGYGERFIREAMELADAPDEIKHLLSSQAVTPSLALAELRANGAAAVETLKAAAVAAQSSGQKTAKRAKAPVKSAKPQPAPAPAVKPSAPSLPIGVKLAIMALLEDVPAEDLNDIKGVAVVKVAKLLKLASLIVTEEDLKTVGVAA